MTDQDSTDASAPVTPRTASGAGPRYRRSDAFVSRRVADEMLLIPVGTRATHPRHRAGDLCALNETGEYLWSQLASPQGVEDLVRNLIQYFDVDAERARADVERFVADLLALEAIHPVEGTS